MIASLPVQLNGFRVLALPRYQVLPGPARLYVYVGIVYGPILASVHPNHSNEYRSIDILPTDEIPGERNPERREKFEQH